MKYLESKSCAKQCHSRQHALELNGLLTRTNDVHVLLSGLLQCWNCQKIQDIYGRHLLHMAASCGRAEVCEWLVKIKKAEMNLKTMENGWTPLHTAAFYGQINALIAMIKLGADLTKNDYDRLTPLEHLSLDKLLQTKYQPDLTDDFDVYCWGSNVNFNLGNGHGTKNSNAELLEFFKKSSTSIIDIRMSKFHTVFLAKSGQVYTCGFGKDGRLGHNNETTLISPKQVELLKNENIVQIAASRNNTYFLNSEGNVYSCGTNEFRQLGQPGVEKALSPRLINVGKRFKGSRVKRIECSRFHCVLLTSSEQVYTFGLNAGQLGHPNEMVADAISYNNSICYITEARLISALNEPDLVITDVACSDGCTVALTQSHIYLFNDYKLKRINYIKETGGVFRKIRVLGGKLDNCANPELKWIEDLNQKILIVGLTVENLLYTWTEKDPVWRNVCWAGGKTFKVSDFDLNNQGIILSTLQHTCYRAEFSKTKNLLKQQQSVSLGTPEKSKSVEKISPTQQAQRNFNSDLKVIIYDLCQIPLVNRCFRVFSDLKARNFFSLQYHPNTNMINYPVEARSDINSNMHLLFAENVPINKQDSLYASGYSQDFYDIQFKYQSTTFGLHKFVLFSRCAKIFTKIENFQSTVKSVELDSVVGSKFHLKTFELILCFIYTNELDLNLIREALKGSKVNSEAAFVKFMNEFRELVIDKFGLVDLKTSLESSNYLKNLKSLSLNSNENRLELMVDFVGRTVCSNLKRKLLRFSRLAYKELYDCQIECNKEQVISCHKCVLIARSEFFRNMFLGSWIESKSMNIKLPFDMDLMQIIIDYLYSDEIQMEFIHSSNNISSSLKSKNEREIEILFNLYVLSDQLLLERLKNLGEFKLANLVNLKNVVEIWSFSHEYEANQLKDFCMEFICLNLVTLVEAKQLEPVDLSLLNDLALFYKQYYPIVSSRMITPYMNGLDPAKVELIPFDLIYDQKFVDGSFGVNIKQQSSTNTAPDLVSTSPIELLSSSQSLLIIEEDRLGKSESQNDFLSMQTENDTEIPETGELNSNKKWEKVRKKNTNRRKISENYMTETQKSAVAPIGAFYSEKDVTKYNQEKLKVNLTEGIKKMTINEWPDLGQSVNETKKVLAKPTAASSTFSKNSPVTFSTSQSIKKDMAIKKTTEAASKSFAWGNSSPVIVQSPPQLSLLDVMNEEIKNSSLSSSLYESKKDSSKVTTPKTNNKSPMSSQTDGIFKGWNLNEFNQQNYSNTSPNSFASIIEMEKRSKEQYNKLKNRQLGSIQLEEKAIQDLKRLYEVENLTNMTITIELVDDADIQASCAPIWKKS